MGVKNGGLTVSTLVDDGASIAWTGTKGVVTASLKKDPAGLENLYDESERTGYFFPIKFKEEYYDNDVELSGCKAGNKTIKPTSDDPYLIVRLENLSADKLTAKVEKTQEEIFELDFTGVTKQGEP